LQIDRDLNAAMNLQKAASPVVSACGADEADFAAMKQEVS
jgi:transposase